MNLKNNLKSFPKNSTLIPATYTLVTKPFAKQLRRLPAEFPQSPKNAAKVSVVVPNYNYKKYLKKRLQTILSQTYPVSYSGWISLPLPSVTTTFPYIVPTL